MSDMKAFFDDFFREQWEGRSTRVAAEYRAPTLRSTGLASEALGADGYAGFRDRILAAFSSITVKVARCITEGENVALDLRVVAVPAGGRDPISFRGAAFARVRDGKILEADNLFDLLSLHAALGGRFQPAATTLDETAAALVAERAT